MNSKLHLIQAHKGIYGKDKIRQTDLKMVPKVQLKKIIQKRFYNEEEIPDFLFPYHHIELYTIAWEEYLKEMALNLNSNTKANDIYDLQHFLYVSKRNKYWTQEKKWKRLISNSKTGISYLAE